MVQCHQAKAEQRTVREKDFRLLLTSCSSGTAALALSPSLLPKYTHTHSAGHRGMSVCIPLSTCAAQSLLYVLALFLMFESTRV